MQPTPLPLDVGPASRLPLFRQIEEQISDAILDGRLRPGDLLTSSQRLAEQLVISPVATAKAYRDLVSEGLCRYDDEGIRVSELREEVRQRVGRRASRREAVGQLIDRGFSAEELEWAREVQGRLLPPPRVEGDGYVVTARCLPARYVAGDFYDVIPHSDGSVGLIVADVAGKGVASGLITASVKATLPFVTAGRDVDEALRELNRRLCSELGPREFVALTYVRFEPHSGRLRVGNAGMPCPYRLGAGALPAELAIPGPRLPLGIHSHVEYQSLQLQLGLHERLLLLSDGIPEARGMGADPLGYVRFGELLADHAPGAGIDSGEWLDHLLAAVDTAVCGDPGDAPGQRNWEESLNDDWTALLLERRPFVGEP